MRALCVGGPLHGQFMDYDGPHFCVYRYYNYPIKLKYETIDSCDTDKIARYNLQVFYCDGKTPIKLWVCE